MIATHSLHHFPLSKYVFGCTFISFNRASRLIRINSAMFGSASPLLSHRASALRLAFLVKLLSLASALGQNRFYILLKIAFKFMPDACIFEVPLHFATHQLEEIVHPASSACILSKLALIGTDASQSGEDYWQSVWPNTPLPKALSDLLLPYSKMNIPIRAEEEKQYWTVFFEHDLYPGKKMSLGVHKHSDIQRSRVQLLIRKASQPFGAKIWVEKESQPFGVRTWETREKTSQPFGQRTWGETERDGLDDICGNPSAIGEDKYCASSLESMMDFAISKLGMNIKVISSFFAQNQDEYVVEEVKKIGDKAVMCHRLNFEKVVFYCHQVNATTSYMVPLVASDGTKAKALTICHHDTRGMNPNVLYEVLKVKPGTVPVCHFVGNKAIAWVPKRDVSESDDHPCVI